MLDVNLRSRLSAAPVLVTALLTTLGICLLDIWTGAAVRLYPLYFVPIVLAASNLPNWHAMLVATAGLTGWFVAKLLDGTVFPSVAVWVINFAIQGAGLYFVAGLVQRLKKLRDKETEAARRDPLTGLPNTRGYRESAGLVLELARRYPSPMAFAYLDLDNFKQVNDEQGHQRGDEVLILAAQTMREALRSTDVLARQGGDEFVVLMPQVTAADATQSLQRLCDMLARTMRANGCGVTMSAGAVAYECPPANLDEMFKAADALMYEIKKTGKNGVRILEA